MLVGSMIREQHQASSGATDVRVHMDGLTGRAVVSIGNSCPDWSERSDESEHIGAGRIFSDRREQPEGHQLEGLLFDPREEAGERDPLEFGSGQAYERERGARGMGCGVDVDCRRVLALS
jgi:hypothetical protein